MARFEIFVAPEPPKADTDAGVATDATDSVPPKASSRRERTRPAREVLDVFIEGANVTARVADAQASCVLRDLGAAVADLAAHPRGKAIVRFYDDPWEMCVERFGKAASLSVYRTGADPYVAVYDRFVAFDEVTDSVRDAIDAAIDRNTAPAAVALELAAAAGALRTLTLARVAEPADAATLPDWKTEEGPPASPVAIEIDRDAPISFAAEFALRSGTASSSDPSVERADLHALLFRGRLRAEIRGRAVELADGHPFLFAERILEVSRKALDAWERGLPYNVRVETGGLLLGLRLSGTGSAGSHLALTLGQAAKATAIDRALYTFPALGVADVVEAALAFGRSLVRALLRRDRSQCTNLRLSAFRRQLREASETLREVCRDDTKINPSPESYRAFVVAGSPSSTPRANGRDRGLATARLRYASRWRALVPGVDLRATFLCGDRLIVGAAQETFCLERSTGNVLWRAETEKATSVVTPGGIARLSPDGTLRVHDFGNGEVTLKVKLAPRAGGPAAGAVVSVPGLPRLLIVTEGEHHLVAIDLTSGEPRWRFTWGKKERRGKTGALRLKRAGKLLYFTSGDSALTALDVLTGAVVWRARDRLRFRTPPTLDHDNLFAASGGVNCLAQLHAIDPYAGRTRWSAVIPGPEGGRVARPCTIEGSPLTAGGRVAIAVRDRSALRLVAFDRDTGQSAWSSRGPVAPIGTSWLAVDDLLIGNTPSGEIVAIEAESGELRYRRVLGPRVLDADVPRRLEPVLRCGALFVPHADIHVLRPHDGETLATIAPCEAIPDLLRVDERCDVYVAEESGHLVSFTAMARLSLVSGGGSTRARE